MKHKVFIEIEYNDESSFSFNVDIEGKEHEILAHIMQITRGTLMASSATKATAYREDGFPICAYVNN